MFNLLKRIYPALRNFPKSEKFALAQDIRLHFYKYLSYINRANRVKSKRLEYAQEAEGALDDIKTSVNLAYHLRYISQGFYESISLELTEVSKMLTMYIRSTTKR